MLSIFNEKYKIVLHTPHFNEQCGDNFKMALDVFQERVPDQPRTGQSNAWN